VFIPKADGRQRPLGVATTEDKTVQSAVVEVLNASHEADFLGFSYGFRPGRKPHDARPAAGLDWLHRIPITRSLYDEGVCCFAAVVTRTAA
jgi:hypothetical protein